MSARLSVNQSPSCLPKSGSSAAQGSREFADEIVRLDLEVAGVLFDVKFSSWRLCRWRGPRYPIYRAAAFSIASVIFACHSGSVGASMESSSVFAGVSSQLAGMAIWASIE